MPAEIDLDGDAEDRTTVLVVDDNADVRAYVRTILARSYRVIEAADGRSGLELARAALLDLITADVMMPELDGLALGRALKDDAIPVVFLTARATAEDHIAGLETGVDAYLVKPFDAGMLEACVANLVAQRRRLRERFRDYRVEVPREAVDVLLWHEDSRVRARDLTDVLCSRVTIVAQSRRTD